MKSNFNPKMALLTIAVSSCMLTACGHKSKNNYNHPPPAEPPKDTIKMVTTDKVEDLAESDKNNITDIKVVDDNKLSVKLPSNAETLKVLDKGEVLYLPPSDDLPFGYSGMVEQKNADGTVLMREATLEEVFDELDIDFNSGREVSNTQVGVINLNPNIKMQIQDGHQAGLDDFSRNYQSCKVENYVYSFLDSIDKKLNGSNQNPNVQQTSSKLLKFTVPFLNSKSVDLDFSRSCEPIQNNRFAEKTDKIGERFNVKMTLPLAKGKNEESVEFTIDFDMADVLIKQKMQYKNHQWKEFEYSVSGSIATKISLDGKAGEASLSELLGTKEYAKVWDSLTLEAGNNVIGGKLYGLDSKDKEGLFPLGGFIISPTPLSGGINFGNINARKLYKAKPLAVVIWVYLRADGTLVLDGNLAAGMERMQFYKGITLTPSERDPKQLIPKVINEGDGPALYLSGNAKASAEITTGATVSADLLVAGIRPVALQLNPIKYTHNFDLEGDVNYTFFSKNPTYPVGYDGSFCASQSSGITSDLWVSAKLGAEVHIFGWKRSGELGYTNTVAEKVWKDKDNNKQVQCYVRTPLKPAFKLADVTNVPKQISIDVDYSKEKLAYREEQKKEFIDEWRIKVTNLQTKKISHIRLPKNADQYTFALPYGHDYDVALVAMGNPFKATQLQEIASSKATRFNLGTDPAQVQISSVTITPNEIGVGQKYRVTIKGNMLLSGFRIAGCQSPKLIDSSQYQVIYECTAPNVGQSLLLNISSPDGKHQYHRAGIVVHNKPLIPSITPTKLPATGITLCGNANDNNIACQLLTGDWKGLRQDGEVRAGQPMSYTILNRNNAECVQDKVTGLIWEQKTDDGTLRDKDNRYTWYNPDNRNNRGSAGSYNNGKNTLTYIEQLNASNYCGYNDWRLPSQDELLSIVDYGRHNPVIDPMFVNTQTDFYWSSSSYASSNNNAWGVSFRGGNGHGLNKNNSHYVRVVRSE